MVWTYSQQFGTQIFSFVVSIILARLLLPEEFGLIGMLAIFMGVGTALFEGGMTSSLIRIKEVNDDDFSTVFIFNLIVSVLVYALLFIAAPYIADFYHQSTLKLITRLYGLTFIFSAFGAVQNTILTRNLNFKKQTLIALPALLISSIVGVILAFQNYGVYSLVFSALVNAFLTSLFLTVSSEWKMKLDFDKAKFNLHFNYGYKMTLSSILDTVFINIYQIIIGRYYSANLVGLYSRSNQLLMLPVGNVSGALNKVIFPLFSKVQDDIPRFRSLYKRIMLLVLFIVTPIVVLMGVLAQPLIVFLFTDKWIEAVPIFQIICFTGVLYPIHMYNLVVLQVMGRSDLFLKLEIIKKVVLAVIIFISFFYGFYALLWGQLIASVIALFINTHYAGKMLSYTMWQQMNDLLPIFLSALIIGIACYGIDNMLSNYDDIVRLIITGCFGITLYLLTAFIFKFQSIQDIKNLILKK